jgi:D-arabinose 1-dehydrogenase-like Zn-dependent alcohol dehydrogenase
MKNRPKSVKAAILVGQNQSLVIDNIDFPEKLLPGQVLVKVECSGICGSQIGEISGAKGVDKYLPHLMGHEGCGYGGLIWVAIQETILLFILNNETPS